MADLEPEQPLPTPRTAVPDRLVRRTSYSTRMMAWIRLWSRDTFSRDQMISSLKSLAWVAPLTILIWVSAEREQLSTVTNQTIPISVKSADPTLIVTVIDPADQNITAELVGPRISVDKVTEQIKLIPKSDQGVMIEIPPSYVPGRYTIPSSLVSDADMFRRTGVTISKTSPQNLHIEIDKIVDRDLDVQMPGDVQNLVGTPTFEPRKVRISGPQSVLDTAEARGQLNVYADFKGLRERQSLKVPGKHDLVNVPVVVPFSDKNLTVSPITVNATVEVRQLDVEYKKNSIPVYVTYPHPVDAQFRAEYEDSLPDVTMIGPSEQIEAMQRPGFDPQPKARFEVAPPSSKDPVGQTRTARLQFDLPPGVRMSPDDEKRTIQYKLVKLNPNE
ncbi:hypothetical protein BH10PLA1_BH10PLA1_19310 [soil metagenome]